MDKRKGIILAIVLFLIVGLGTFVFAGGSEGQDNAINPLDDGEDPITPPTSGEEGTDPAVDGESEGEGGSEESDPAGGYVDNDEQDDQGGQSDIADSDNSGNGNQGQDNNGQGNAEDTAYQQALALITYLEDQIAKAEVRKTLDDAVNYRNSNKVAEKIAALTDGEDKTDLANRLDAINTILNDTVGPVIDGLPTTKLTNQIVSLSVREEGVTVTLNGEAVTLDDIKNLSKDGTYKVVVTDKALNSTTAEFTVDRTPIAMSHLYILNHTYHLDSNYTDKHYTVIGNDQELYVELVLEEEFASTPVITVGDGEGVEMTCGTASWDDTLYKCDAFVTISEDMNFENGDAITFDITGVKDAAGNELEIDERLIVETDKYGKVIYDKQAPSVVWLYTLNADDDENLQVIGDGLDLLVELRVDEELLEYPTIKIGGYTATLTRRDDSKGRFIYEKRITIDEELMELVDNEVIPFVITATDAAGNEVTFTKATTNTDAGYGEVVYDGSAPEYKNLGILNVTHLRLNNEGASESLTVANIGDEVRVLVRFDEKPALTPRLQVGDVTKFMILNEYSTNYTYYADVTITAEMFAEDGEINFQVSGYADAVGNVGEVLDVDDIKGYEDYSGVTLDTTKPLMTINGESNITLEAGDTYDELGVTVEDAVDGTKVLKPVRINYSIDGKFLGTVPAVDPTKPGTYKVVYEYTDAAGNVGVDADRQDHDFIIRTVTVEKIETYFEFTEPDSNVYDGNEKEFEMVLKDQFGNILDKETINIAVKDENNELADLIDAGDYTISAHYAGSDMYEAEYIWLEYTIEQAATQFELVYPDSNVYSGTEKTIGFVLKDQHGNVLNETVSTAIRTEDGVDTTLVDAGTYIITAHYAESNNYKATHLYEEYVIEQAATEIILTYPDSLVADGTPKEFKAELWDITNDKLVKELTPVYQDANGNRGDAINAGKYNVIVHSGYMNNYKADYITEGFEILPEGTTSLVNGVSYETLKDAVDAAKVNGGTVELVADVVNSTSIGIANNQEVTIDLNGNDISFASDRYFAVSGGTLTLTGEGTVKESDPYYGPILIKRSFIQGRPLTINVDEGVTLEGSSGIFVDYGKMNFAMNTTINLKGNINSVRDRAGNVGYAIYVQGKIENTNNYPVINIYEGSEINSVGMGIYAAGYAEWNIYGGIINAKETAIGIKSGKLNITGGTFTADGVNNIPTPAWGNGMNGSGSALQIESNDGYAQGMEINISGGEFISENAAAIYEYPADATTSVIDFTITGGTFKSTNYSSNFVFSQSFTKTHQGFMSNITFDKENSVLDNYLAEGFVVEEQADGTYKVVQG